MTDSPHPGAPKGNTNALKHGFYSRSFRAAEQTGLNEFDPTSLQNEIELMRVFMLRTAELGEQASTLAESMTLLNVLSRAAISLGVLIRTQQALTVRKESAELADLSAQLNAATRRASALLKLLPPQQPPVANPSETGPTARRASDIPSTSGRGQGEGSSLPPAPTSGQAKGSSLPPTPCETDQNLHHEDAKDAEKAETGQENAALDTQSALSSSRSSRLRGASSFDPPTPIPEPIYTLSPENCLPSPKCFTCPDRSLCPDCQTYLHTHTPPQNDVDRKIEGIPLSATKAAENGTPSAPLPFRGEAGGEVLLPFPLSLFYTIDPPSPNCSELFPPNNSPSQSQETA